MAELEERIARLRELLAAPDADLDEAVVRHNLLQLQQLRSELTLS